MYLKGRIGEWGEGIQEGWDMREWLTQDLLNHP